MIKFEKVSYDRFVKDYVAVFGAKIGDFDAYDNNGQALLTAMYENIKLPTRATSGSCGYDFYSPINFILQGTNSDITIPTGIRVQMDEDKFLLIGPRSGLGTKHYIRLANTIGFIDSDYYYSSNEGHIHAKIRLENHLKEELRINAGERIIQGVFLPYFKTDDDNVTSARDGGFGSTGNG